MTTQNYLMIQNNIVTNLCLWDGDTSTWQPPSDTTMLIQADINAMIWKLNTDKTSYVLTEVLGAGGIGFTWDGTVVTTNESQPANPQIKTTGTQTA